MNIREIRFAHSVKVPGTSDLKTGLQSLFDGKPAWVIEWDGGQAVKLSAAPGSIYAKHSPEPWWVPLYNVTCMQELVEPHPYKYVQPASAAADLAEDLRINAKPDRMAAARAAKAAKANVPPISE